MIHKFFSTDLFVKLTVFSQLSCHPKGAAPKLIKSISDRYFENIEGIVLRGAQSGTLSKDIAQQISAQFGVTDRRAALIARDQVAKFNGNLNQQRQKSAGITKYLTSA